MSEAENMRMVRFFHWLCDNKKMSSWDAKNELDLLDQIVAQTYRNGVSRKCSVGKQWADCRIFR